MIAPSREALKALGIGAGITTVLLIAGFGFYAYKNYFDLKKTKLQISALERDLSIKDSEG